MNNFTKEELRAAKETRETIIKEGIPELASIYMAGEICMWDEMQQAKNCTIPDVSKRSELLFAFITWYADKFEMKFTDEYKTKLVDEFKSKL